MHIAIIFFFFCLEMKVGSLSIRSGEESRKRCKVLAGIMTYHVNVYNVNNAVFICYPNIFLFFFSSSYKTIFETFGHFVMTNDPFNSNCN